MLDSEKLTLKKKNFNQLIDEGSKRRSLSGEYLLKIVSKAIDEKNNDFKN